MQLVLRCANVSRKGGSWSEHDYDLFDGIVGRIYLVDAYGGRETWFWGVSFLLTGASAAGIWIRWMTSRRLSGQNTRLGNGRPPMEKMILEMRAIPWERHDLWGVAIRYSDRTKVAYPVGRREDAEREVERLTPAPASQPA
jgi:hypothetical protein